MEKIRKLKKKFKRWFEQWKPIHLCWLFDHYGWPIPRYLIGGGDAAPIYEGSRIADASRSWQAAEDADVTGWTVGDSFCISIGFGTASGKKSNSRELRIRWRNVTDGGSFADLGSTGELRWASDTNLVNDNALTEAESGLTSSQTFDTSAGIERESANAYTYPSIGAGSWGAVMWAIDTGNALGSKQYEFELYNVTDAAQVAVASAQITTAAAVVGVTVVLTDNFSSSTVPSTSAKGGANVTLNSISSASTVPSMSAKGGAVVTLNSISSSSTVPNVGAKGGAVVTLNSISSSSTVPDLKAAFGIIVQLAANVAASTVLALAITGTATIGLAEISSASTVPAIAVSVEAPVIVDTDGTSGDYASLNAMQSGEAGTLSAPLEVLCQATTGVADTVAVSMSGWTTTATNKVIIRQAVSDRHDGTYDTANYRHQVSSAANITLANASSFFVDFDGIQFDLGTPNGNNQGGIFARTTGGTSVINVDACIFVGDAVTGGSFNYHDGIQAYTTSPITFNVTNCLFYDITRTSSYGVSMYEDTANVDNCTFYNCLGSCYASGATFEVWNNLTWDAPFVGTFVGTSDYNSANGTSATNLNSTKTSGSPWDSSGDSVSDYFLDAGADDFRPGTGDLHLDEGYDLSGTFTDDCVGTDRGTGVGVWDLGYFEFIIAGDITVILTAAISTSTVPDMVYVDKVVVDTDGTSGDYASLSAFQSGYTPKDLVTNKQRVIVECQASGSAADTTSTIITGWTTSASNDLTIQPADSDRHSGKWDATKYRREISNNEALFIQSDVHYCTIDGLQLQGTNNNSSWQRGIQIIPSDGGHSVVKNCIVVGVLTGTSDACHGIFFDYHASNFASGEIYNNLIIGWDNPGYTELSGVSINTAGWDLVPVSNNTIVDCQTGYYSLPSDCVLTNNVVRGADAAGATGDTSNSDYNSSNISGDATVQTPRVNTASPWYSGATSDAGIFIDSSADDYRLSQRSIMQEVGDDLSADFNTDAVGTSRGTGTQSFDLGFHHQIVSETIVDTDGTTGDYASLNAWHSGEARNLTTNNKQALAICQASASVGDNQNVVITGWTLDANHDLEIRVADSDRHSGNWDTSLYTFEANPGAQNASIEIDQGFVTIDGFQMNVPTPGSSDECIRIKTTNSTDPVYIKNCIFADLSYAQADAIYAGDVDCLVYVENCLFYIVFRTPIHAQSYVATARTQEWHINNCAFIDCGKGGEAESGAIYARTNHVDTVITVNAKNNLVRSHSRALTGFGQMSSQGTVTWVCDYNSGDKQDISDKNAAGRQWADGGPWRNKVVNSSGSSGGSTDAGMMQDANNYYVGATFTPSLTRGPFSAVSVETDSVSGNVNSKTYYCEVWELSGNNLGTMVARSLGSPGPAFNTTTSSVSHQFQFEQPFSLSGSTAYAIVIHMNGFDAANYSHWSYANSAQTWYHGEATNRNSYTSAGVRTLNNTTEGWNIYLLEEGGADIELFKDLKEHVPLRDETSDLHILTDCFLVGVGADMSGSYLEDWEGDLWSGTYDLGADKANAVIARLTAGISASTVPNVTIVIGAVGVTVPLDLISSASTVPAITVFVAQGVDVGLGGVSSSTMVPDILTRTGHLEYLGAVSSASTVPALTVTGGATVSLAGISSASTVPALIVLTTGGVDVPLVGISSTSVVPDLGVLGEAFVPLFGISSASTVPVLGVRTGHLELLGTPFSASTVPNVSALMGISIQFDLISSASTVPDILIKTGHLGLLGTPSSASTVPDISVAGQAFIGLVGISSTSTVPAVGIVTGYTVYLEGISSTSTVPAVTILTAGGITVPVDAVVSASTVPAVYIITEVNLILDALVSTSTVPAIFTKQGSLHVLDVVASTSTVPLARAYTGAFASLSAQASATTVPALGILTEVNLLLGAVVSTSVVPPVSVSASGGVVVPFAAIVSSTTIPSPYVITESLISLGGIQSTTIIPNLTVQTAGVINVVLTALVSATTIPDVIATGGALISMDALVGATTVPALDSVIGQAVVSLGLISSSTTIPNVLAGRLITVPAKYDFIAQQVVTDFIAQGVTRSFIVTAKSTFIEEA